MEQEVLRTAVVHRSLTRPQLIAGCDRTLFIIVTLLSIFLAIPGGIMSESLFNIVFGIGLFFFGLVSLSWMAKKDPSMRQVFMRSLGYKDRYPARSCVTFVTRRKIDAEWV